MSQEIINLGAAPNDGTGDDLRTGGEKINSNFTELYELLPAALEAATVFAHPFQAWADLLAVAADMPDGLKAEVSAADPGTHADDPLLGTVPNSGVYEKQPGQAIPVWIEELDSTRAAANADLAGDKVIEAGEVVAAFTSAATGIKAGTLALDETTGKELLGFNTTGDARVNGIEFNRAVPDNDGFVHLVGDGIRRILTIEDISGLLDFGGVTPGCAARLAVAIGGAMATGAGSLDLSNVDKIVLVSNSYGESKATLKGKSDSMNASALSEYNWGNVSLGGQGCAELAAIVANNTVRFGATFAQLRPTFAILREQQNSKITNGLSDPDYYRDYQRLIDTVRGQGAEPVIITEWGVGVDTGVPPAAVSVDGEQRNIKGLRALADANRCLFYDGTSKSRTMNPSAYGPFYKSAHPGQRQTHLSSDALIRCESQLPRPRKGSMKIFRVRATVTVATVADLVFLDIQARHHLFRELYIGHNPLNDTGRQYYDTTTALGVAGYNTEQADEYHALQLGAATALGTHALVDCVLEYANARGVKLQLSDTTVTVYALQKTNTGASWIALSLDDDNLFDVPNDQGLVSYDCIRFLLYKASGISLTASPKVTNETGVEKVSEWKMLPPPPTGAELLVQPLTVVAGIIPAQWTNSGGLAVATLVDGAAYLPGGNQTPALTTGGVEVTSSAGLAQDIPLAVTVDPVEVSIRVWARRQPALFNSASDWSTAPINEETCDTATLLITLHGAGGITSASAPMKAQVGLAHTEVEFRMTLPAYSTARRIDVRSFDSPILVTKVMVARA